MVRGRRACARGGTHRGVRRDQAAVQRQAGDHPLAVLAVRTALAYTSEVDTVFFAEYHQGIRGTRTRAEVLGDFFLGRPGGRTLLHLIAVCFLILACLGLRFGTPAPGVAPPDRERRSPLEHVSALGRPVPKGRRLQHGGTPSAVAARESGASSPAPHQGGSRRAAAATRHRGRSEHAAGAGAEGLARGPGGPGGHRRRNR